jgi:hypothetical protein
MAGKFQSRGIDPQDAAAWAWAGMLGTYWSATSKTRFVGDSKIVTMLWNIARACIIRELYPGRTRRSSAAADAPSADAGTDEYAGSRTVPLDDLTEELESPAPQPDHDYMQRDQYRALLRVMRGTLTTRQWIFATMVWIRGEKKRVVAKRVGCAPANVTQVLTRAEEALTPVVAAHPEWRAWLESRRRNER